MKLIISLAAAVALISCLVTGETIQRECRATWEKYENTQVKGLTQQGSIKTEAECKATCESKDDCWNIDFNFKDSSCWFGSQHKPEARVLDTAVHHWDLTKDCTDEHVKTDCTLSWEKFEKTQVIGLSQQTEIKTEDGCKAICETKDGCWNIDFNFNDNGCWHGTEHKPTNKVVAGTVTHWDLSKVCTEAPPRPTGADCGAIHQAHPDAESGVYGLIVPGKTSPVQVYCDMETSGGGWTVFQRRKDGSVNFTRNWSDYANGFGKPDGEYWLGNDNLATLTGARSYRLRVDIGYWNGTNRYAEYNDFKVAGAADKYRLTFSNCSYFGDAGNRLERQGTDKHVTHNGVRFSTYDQDNDNVAASNCANAFHGGWWYNSCHSCELNGEYNNTVQGQGIIWNDYTYSLKSSEMKIRPVYY